jgi:two-component sensor histidine kinase
MKSLRFMSLAFSPERQLIRPTSLLIRDFLDAALRDPDTVSRLHMAAHELTENIVKYSAGTRVGIELELAQQERGCTLRVTASNDAEQARLRDVQDLLEHLKQSDNPRSVYEGLMRRSALLEGVSGLGLARIRVEAGLELDYAIEGTRLTIMFQAPVEVPSEQCLNRTST